MTEDFTLSIDAQSAAKGRLTALLSLIEEASQKAIEVSIEKLGEFNNGELFFDGNKEKGLPRWAGYKIGYYLVKQYLKKTKKKASELIGEASDPFLS